MASLFDINERLLDAFDIETGEQTVTDEELEALFTEKNEKLEQYAMYIKELKAHCESIKAEEYILKTRRESKERLMERLKGILSVNLNYGDRFESSRVRITWRKSESVELADENAFIESNKGSDWVKEKTTYSVDKIALKDAMKVGEIIDGVELKVKNNIQIK